MNISVNPAKLVISADPETAQISAGSQIVTEYIECPVYEGPTEVTPSEEEQTLLTEGYRLESDVTISAIPSDYVGSGIPHEHSEDLTASGATVSAPAGYYEEAVSKAVQSGSVSVPDITITADPSIQLASGTGLIRASVFTSKSISPSVNEGYVTSGESGAVTVSGEKSLSLNTVSGSTITPTESEQTAVDAYKWTTGEVKVGAIASDYVGSGITRNDSSDLTARGAIVTAPAGYYHEAAIKTISSGAEGTPTATKGTVTDHSVSVTPSVTNSAGYISGGTHNGSPVIVSASELVSGSQTVTANDTYDVTNLASFTVAVPGSTPNLQAKTNIDPTTSSQTIQADSGYDGLASVQINAMPSGTAGTPTASKGTVSNHSVTVTPSVTNTAGYISGGTKTGTGVTVTVSELESGTKSITSNGTDIDVSGYSKVDVSVSGGGMNKQIYYGPANVKNNGYIASSAELTVATTGKYKVSWTAWRSSSTGTMGTNLYKNGTAGTNQQTFTGTYGQCITLTNQSYTAGDVLTIYATSGSNSRTIYIANFVIEQTA